MMSMNWKKRSCYLCEVLFLLALIVMNSCGGGSADSAHVTPVGTPVNLSEIKGVFEGTASPGTIVSFSMGGSTSSGENLTGTFSFTITAPTMTSTPTGTQTLTVCQEYTSLTVINAGVTESTITNYYTYQTGYLYRSIDEDGVAGTPTAQALLPASAKVGDSGVFTTITFSDGSWETSIWRIDPGLNGDAKLVLLFTFRDNRSTQAATGEDTYTIKPDGRMSAMTSKYSSINPAFTITVSGNRE